jgi:hypothetical protein
MEPAYGVCMCSFRYMRDVLSFLGIALVDQFLLVDSIKNVSEPFSLVCTALGFFSN